MRRAVIALTTSSATFSVADSLLIHSTGFSNQGT
jgi:hypothetical protein